MIARVRIAPIEQWCPPKRGVAERRQAESAALVGKEVQIFTETMSKSLFSACGGRTWKCDDASTNLIAAAWPGERGCKPNVNTYLCEHFLEMD